MKLKRFLEEAYDYKLLKKNKVPLEPEEREKVMKAGAVWHSGPNGEAQAAVWKTKDSKGNVKYCCNTHRAIQIKDTLAGAIKAFDFIRTTA